MNREDTKKAISVMQSYVDGEEIEFRKLDTEELWARCQPIWQFLKYDYRVKPKPREIEVLYDGVMVKFREVIDD